MAYDKIRAALENTLNSIVGIPAIAWENVPYTPTTGTSYVVPRFAPTIRQPATRGTNPSIYYQGVFNVDCYVEEGTGPGAADDLADLIISTFEAATDVSYGGTIVSIRYAERGLGYQDGAFYVVPVVIGWYQYT